jgi:hypothetical protein
MATSRHLAMLSGLLAGLGAVCLVAVPLMRQAAAAAPSVALQPALLPGRIYLSRVQAHVLGCWHIVSRS